MNPRKLGYSPTVRELLACLDAGPLDGYALLLAANRGRWGNVRKWTLARLYARLAQMEEAGLLRSWTVHGEGFYTRHFAKACE